MLTRDPGDIVPLGLESGTKTTCLIAYALWEPPYIYGINYTSENPAYSECENMPENEYDEILEPDVTTYTYTIPKLEPNALG